MSGPRTVLGDLHFYTCERHFLSTFPRPVNMGSFSERIKAKSWRLLYFIFFYFVACFSFLFWTLHLFQLTTDKKASLSPLLVIQSLCSLCHRTIKKKKNLQFHFLNSFLQGGLLQGKCKSGIPGYIPCSLSLTIFGLDEFIFKPNPSGNAFIKLSTTKYEMQYLARRLKTCDQEPLFRALRHGIYFPILCNIK